MGLTRTIQLKVLKGASIPFVIHDVSAQLLGGRQCKYMDKMNQR